MATPYPGRLYHTFVSVSVVWPLLDAWACRGVDLAGEGSIADQGIASASLFVTC